MQLDLRLTLGVPRGGGGIPSDPILATDHPNLVAMYTMDSINGVTLEDETANNYDGTISGATPVAGAIGNALNFDGSDQVVLPAYGNFGSSTDFTITAWVKTTDNTKNKTIICKRSPSAYAGWLAAVKTDGTLIANISDGVTAAEAQSTTTINDGSYHFCVFSFDRGGNAYIQVDDGVAEGATSLSGIVSVNGSAQVTIGNKSPTTPAGTSVTEMIGDIDQIRIFNRILTPAEKTALYAEGTP